MNKAEILKNFNESYLVKNRKNKYSNLDLKLIWLVDDLLNMTTDDDELSINIGKDILKLLRDIYSFNNDSSYSFNTNYELYKSTMIYKNLIEHHGFYLEFGTSYRSAWFDYDCKDFIINEDDMKWFLFKFMDIEA